VAERVDQAFTGAWWSQIGVTCLRLDFAVMFQYQPLSSLLTVIDWSKSWTHEIQNLYDILARRDARLVATSLSKTAQLREIWEHAMLTNVVTK